MKKMNGLAALLLMAMLFTGMCVHAINVIPKPKSMQESNQSFALQPTTKIVYSKTLKEKAQMMADLLSPATGWDFDLEQGKKAQKNAINMVLDAGADMTKEAYQLSVTNNKVEIVAKTEAGIFNGMQTLLQLLPEGIYNKCRQKGEQWTLPGVEIADEPVYPWRGMMLDVSRYFYEKEYVLHLIDMMAMYKMNVLHLHLIDDAGWRLEIKKYPKLTSVGGFRGEGSERIGGYYTQDDIREIVAYATARNVEVIPEVEVPAHTLAAIAAYPELSCTGKPQIVQTRHSISRELYCVGKQSTFDFLADVFEEVTALFPSKYIHIGGDEARYDRWEKCPDCQALKKRLGLKNEKQLQVYFNQEMQKMLKKYNKTIVGWDEIIEDGLTEKAVGMVWHNKKKAIVGAKAGHDLVMALTGHCYFDVAESKIPGEVKAATWLPPISLEKTYAMDLMVEGLDAKYSKQVLGGHGCLWTDQFIHGDKLPRIEPINENRAEQYLDYLTLPRMSALAEVLWTPKKQQSWNDFEQRMKSHYVRYDNAGFGYRVPQPKLVSNKEVAGGYEIVLENVVKGAHITYTTDGSWVNTYSTTYTKPFVVKNLTDFQAMTVLNRRQFSLPLYFPEKYDKFKKYGKLVAEWKPKNLKGKVYSDFEINATGKINSNGTYEVAFWYTGGSYRLDISGIEVFKNGKKVAEDIHFGYTGGSYDKNTYRFKIDCYETGAAFTIKAKVRGDEGNDSKGAVFIRKK
ncbi:hypothetical protein EMN47_03915 [Prolixibacteraceae bacterium JC049]|nr:hypothetical protein [Prolixibacteraceae bacterium JC049]